MIHNEDNGEVKIKITSDGDLFAFCPECGGVWQTSLNTIHKPKEERSVTYGGAGIKLDMGSSGSAVTKKSGTGKAAIAKALFPEAYE